MHISRTSDFCRLSFGGSLIRPEATGYGLVYFAQEVLEERNDSLKVIVLQIFYIQVWLDSR